MLQINIAHYLLSFFISFALPLACYGEDSAFQFILQPHDHVVIGGEEITLDCQLGLYLHRQLLPVRPDSVMWFENERQITGSDPRHVLHPINNSLTLLIDQNQPATEAGSDETRHYRCNVHLPRGFVLSSRTATVGSQHSPQDELKIPPSLTVMNGTDRRISCNSKALSSWSSSRPLITWSKAGAVIGTSRDVIKTLPAHSLVLADGSLQLLGVTQADEGIYRCAISYRTGNRSSNELRLSVEEQARLTVRGVLPVKNITAFAGEEVYLHCTDSPSSTTWLHGEDSISETKRHVKYDNGGLLIRDVKVDDAGAYSCSFFKEDKELSTQVVQFDLIVLAAPRFDSSPQKIYRLDPSIADPPKVIPCSYKGFPPPTVQWLKDGRVCGSHQVDGDGNLMIQDPVSMSGYYQCVACNRLGCEQSITQICANPTQQLPFESEKVGIRSTSYHAPSQLKVIEYSVDYARLSWSPPVDSGTMEELTYLVSTTTSSTTDNSTRVDISFQPQAIISGLKENEMYRAEVVACYTNYQGCSRASNSIRFKLARSAQIASVISLKAKTISATSIDVYWFPTLEDEEWDKYKVMLIDSDGTRTSAYVGKSWYSFTNLLATTRYSLKVAGMTEDGMIGEWSNELSVTTSRLAPKIDTTPTNVKIYDYNSTSMTVTWDPIGSNSTYKILGYKIQLKDRFSKQKSTYEVAPNVTSFTLNIVGKKEYFVRVCAFNEAGDGPLSNRISHSTSTLSLLKGENVKMPEKPEIRDTTSTSTTITIKWRSPRRLSTITKYRIRWGEKTPNDRQTDLDRTVSSYTMAGLKPGTMYRVAISAIDHGTVGKETLLEPRTEKKREPVLELYPPLGVSIKVLSATSMNVSWGDKEVRKGRYYYKVRCKTSAPVEQRVRFFNTTSQFYLVQGLRPYTYYEISVCVIQGKHTSDWSMIASARSMETKPGSPPSDLTIMATDDPTTVKVNWQPPELPNGHLDGTLIWYTVDFNLDLSEWGLKPVLGGGLSTKINGLTADTHYYFLAQARNDMGVGPISEMVQYRTGKSEEVSTGETRDVSMSTRNYIIYLVIGIIALLFMIVVAIATIVVCCNDKLPSWSFTKKSDSKTKRRVKYTQPSHVLRSATDLDNTAIYRTPNSSNISRQSMRCKNQTSALSNGVPSNSWSRSTLYRSKPTLYDDRRLDSFDMIPEPLAYPVTCPQMSTDDERVSIPLTNDRYLPPRDNAGTEYTPYIAHYPYDAPLSDCAVDSAYGSDHPLNAISSMTAANQDEMTSHHRNLRSANKLGGCDKAASSSCSSSSGGGGSRRTSNFRPHPPASSGSRKLGGGLMGVDEMNAELADVVEFVEDMKSSANI